MGYVMKSNEIKLNQSNIHSTSTESGFKRWRNDGGKCWVVDEKIKKQELYMCFVLF